MQAVQLFLGVLAVFCVPGHLQPVSSVPLSLLCKNRTRQIFWSFSSVLFLSFYHFSLKATVRFLSSSAAYDAQLHHRRFWNSGVQGSLQIIFDFLNVHFFVCLFFLCEIYRFIIKHVPLYTQHANNHSAILLYLCKPIQPEGKILSPASMKLWSCACLPVTYQIIFVDLLLFPCLNCSLFPADIDYPDDETTDAPITIFDVSDWLFDFLDISKWIWFAHCALSRPSPWTPFIPLTAPDVCSPNPCFHGGTCMTKSPFEFTCACVEPYTGKRCQKGSRGDVGSEGNAFFFSLRFYLQFSVTAKCAKKKNVFPFSHFSKKYLHERQLRTRGLRRQPKQATFLWVQVQTSVPRAQLQSV